MDNPTTPPTTPAEKEFPTIKIPLDQIDIPQDARQHDPDDLDELTQDMAKNQQLQEIIVTPQADRYEVIAGVGRVLAARKLNWTQIKAQVREGLSDADKAHITFSENENRENADPLYQAQQIQKMVAAEGGDQRAVAAKRGLTESKVSRYATIANLPAEVRENLHACKLSLRQVLEIVRLKNSDDQLVIAGKCASDDLSGKALTKLVDQKLGKDDSTPKAHKGNGKSAHNGDTQPGKPDPLADLWPSLTIRATNEGMAWGVTYGPQQITTMKGVSMPAWHFWVVNKGLTPKGNLKKWLLMVADALGDTDKESQDFQKKLEMANSNASSTIVEEEPLDPEIAAMVARQAAKGRIR